MTRHILSLASFASYLCIVLTKPLGADLSNNSTSCLTPQGEESSCASIYECPQHEHLLKRPIGVRRHQWIVFSVLDSKCPDTDAGYNVCCGPTHHPAERGNCDKTVSAFPPKAWTGCCGADASNTDVSIGETKKSSKVEQHPWLALIEYNQESDVKLLCGGSLISGRYVLTAAHCVAGDILVTGTPKNIRLGEYDTINKGQDCVRVDNGGDCNDGTILIPIHQTIPHPDYNAHLKNAPNDIALIRLQQTAPFTDFIRPICLPFQDLTIPSYANVFNMPVAGWGVEPNSQATSNVKTEVNLKFVDNDICKLRYESNGTSLELTSGHVCAGSVSEDSCVGDSGGPLMMSNGLTLELIGVASSEPALCGNPNSTRVFTKVFNYIDWIKSVIVD